MNVVFGKDSIERFILLGLTILNLFFASWYVLNGDLNFHSDIARDFLLLEEFQEKKIVLIGQRAGIGQTFHGPLWLYLNLPVYVISGGNPVAVAWFWIILVVGFLATSFYVAKRLFGEKSGYYYVVLLSSNLIIYAKELSHPAGAMFVMPLFFYTLLRYVSTFELKYLVFHVLLAGLVIQFEMAAGLPLFALSLLYALFHQIREGKLRQAPLFFLVLIPLSTFILFDLRHDFLQFKGLLRYLEEATRSRPNFLHILENRINFMTAIAMPFLFIFDFKHQAWAVILDFANNRLFAPSFIIVLLLLVRQNVLRKLYLTFLYFFVGYFILSLTNRGELLGHHVLPLVPIVFLIFSSLVSFRYKKVFLIIFVFVVIFNMVEATRFVKGSEGFIGKNKESWRFLHDLSLDVFKSQDLEFGYFVYSPGALAYQPKYAMLYTSGQFPEKNVSYFQKKPVTYLVIEPAPPEDPYISDRWWIVNKLRIEKEPQSVIRYPNGYRIERYELTEEEVAVPFDQTADTGIHFR